MADGAARIRIDDRAAPDEQAVPVPPEDVLREATQAAQRVRYYDLTGDPSFDPLRNKRFGWQLVRRGALFAVAGLAVLATRRIFLFLLIVAAVTRSLAILSLDSIVSLLVAIALLIAYLFMPVPALLAAEPPARAPGRGRGHRVRVHPAGGAPPRHAL